MSYIALLLLISFPYLFWASSYFVADDWAVIARNVHISLRDIPQWFITVRGGWYRPLFELYIVVCWRLFGLNPLGYHILSIVLYALVSTIVGVLGKLLTDDTRVGVLAMILFALHNCHSEAVMWISSANELLAGFFALCSIASYVLFRRERNYFWLLVSGLSCVLGLTAKETALFVPIIFIAYDVLFYQRVTGKKASLR